jgi:hypothetical protein
MSKQKNRKNKKKDKKHKKITKDSHKESADPENVKKDVESKI